jgi:hypothetical protein
MDADIRNKYGKDTIQNFWNFVCVIDFNPTKKDNLSVKKQIIRKLPPKTADLYRSIASDLSYDLFNKCYSDMGNQYLYASFDAVGKGEEFYESCFKDPDTIEKILTSVNISNNFSDCFPIEDDYFSPDFL